MGDVAKESREVVRQPDRAADPTSPRGGQILMKRDRYLLFFSCDGSVPSTANANRQLRPEATLSVSLLLEARSLEELDARTEAARTAFGRARNSELMVEDVAKIPEALERCARNPVPGLSSPTTRD
jgi:hypothetical protein